MTGWNGFKPSADMVRALRDERECSLQEARRILIGRRLRRRLQTATHWADVREVLAVIVDDLYEDT